MKKKLEKFASIIIKKGINLRKGQSVYIKVSYDDYLFARLLGQTAYKEGAAYVYINVLDRHLSRALIDHGEEKDLDFNPKFQKTFFDEFLRDDWAYIRVEEVSEMDVYQGADSSRLTRYQKNLKQSVNPLLASLMNDEHAWCVTASPNKAWAELVLGEGATEEELMEVLTPILMLDENDPAKAWEQKLMAIKGRCDKLNEMDLDYIHIEDNATDLKVYLNEGAFWVGGNSVLPSGRPFLPNFPTEEVYNVPDFTRTEGTVRLSRPAFFMENEVLGAEFTFEKGKVVSFRAEKGEEYIREFFSLDEGSSFLGEIALVDEGSPIARSGRIFHSILFDENAACHFALGAGYPSNFGDSASLDTPEKLKKAGCNQSLQHNDVMFSTQNTKITGYKRTGETITLMEKGRFVF